MGFRRYSNTSKKNVGNIVKLTAARKTIKVTGISEESSAEKS